MSMTYIRNYYRVPAKRGMRVVADGKPGRITGSQGQYLRVLLDGQKRFELCHPTWEMRYPADAAVPAARQRGARRPATLGRRVETVKLAGVSR